MYGVMIVIIWQAISLLNHEYKEGDTYAVPQPIRSSGQRNTAGANRERKDLTNHDPSTRAPGRGEKEDVDTDECNHRRHSRS